MTRVDKTLQLYRGTHDREAKSVITARGRGKRNSARQTGGRKSERKMHIQKKSARGKCVRNIIGR